MSRFSQKLFDTICERIADGESLREICAEEEMPNRSSVFKWLANDESLSNHYARAREEQGDGEFDDIRTIANNATPENVQVARLQIDAKKWRAGKLRPKVYGDKLAVDSNVKAEVDMNVGVSPSDDLQRYLDGISQRRGTTGGSSEE